jgi:hypothetical protein
MRPRPRLDNAVHFACAIDVGAALFHRSPCRAAAREPSLHNASTR